MNTKTIVIALVLLFGFSTNLSAAVDPELAELRRQENIKTVMKSLETLAKRLEDGGLTREVREKCGATPEINSSSQITDINYQSSYQKWRNCIEPIARAGQRRANAEKLIEVRMSEIEQLDAEKEVRKACGEIPPEPKDRSDSEAEKFEIKTKTWDECAKTAIENAKQNIDRSELWDEISYIQSRSQEYKLEGQLSDLCTNTPKFLKLTREQLSDSSDILLVKRWVDCSRSRVNEMSAEAKEKKEAETRALEKAQKATEEAKKILEAPKPQKAPVPVVSTPKKEAAKPSIKAEKSVEVVPVAETPAEVPVEVVESKEQPSKIRRIFKNLFSFFGF